MATVKQDKWKKIEYSRKKIIRAGENIKKKLEDSETLKIVDNWRASHGFPLHIIYTHLRRMCKSNPKTIVAERLKRMSSIRLKLNREPNMSLWNMQDLGGCRIIAPDIETALEYAEHYKKSRKRHIFRKERERDYIKTPKLDGYRSLHHIYEYHSDNKDSPYNRNMLIELQFRSRLQHAWATAVEIMGMIKKRAIKSGEGTDEENRFFALVSSLFAILENQPTVPNTPSNKEELISEIKDLNDKYNFLELLSGIKMVAKAKTEGKLKNKSGYLLLILDYEEMKLVISEFALGKFQDANKLYIEIEKKREDYRLDAVLVRVSSVKSLERAYPNYFMDITGFVKIVRSHIGQHPQIGL